jgi:hypothetical protein
MKCTGLAKCRLVKCIWMLAGLGGLAAMAVVPLSAKAVAEEIAQRGTVGYDRAHEITVSGTVQEAVAKAPLGSPAGVHLMVASPQGLVDAHIGPYLTKETQEALHAGTPVEMVGAMETVAGKQYFLVRQVSFGGRVLNVRTANGFLLQVREGNSRHRGAAIQKSGMASNGGAR